MESWSAPAVFQLLAGSHARTRSIFFVSAINPFLLLPFKTCMCKSAHAFRHTISQCMGSDTPFRMLWVGVSAKQSIRFSLSRERTLWCGPLIHVLTPHTEAHSTPLLLAESLHEATYAGWFKVVLDSLLFGLPFLTGAPICSKWSELTAGAGWQKNRDFTVWDGGMRRRRNRG